MAYSNENLELFWLRYQAEGVPAQMSLQQFCSVNKVPYHWVSKWYRDTRTTIAEVKVEGDPGEETPATEWKEISSEKTQEGWRRG